VYVQHRDHFLPAERLISRPVLPFTKTVVRRRDDQAELPSRPAALPSPGRRGDGAHVNLPNLLLPLIPMASRFRRW
jgi:hypothetical protein